jgi:RND family efflux transporter MFP subunit
MSRSKRILIQVLIAIVIVAAGVFGFKALKAGRQTPRQEMPAAPLPLVRTVSAAVGPMEIIVTGYGTVRPVMEIQLVPQVGGKVTMISPSLVDGGFFAKDELMLMVDPADYEIAVTLAEARIKDAESQLEMIGEDAAASREEWHRLNPGEEPPALVAKEPQLAAALARLEAEKANLTDARLKLARTRLKAPFACRVVARQVGYGQYVVPGQPLATLHATDAAEIVIPLEDRDLAWFDLPGYTTTDAIGSPAEVRAEASGREMIWQGRVVRSEGRIDDRTRMHRAVVRVENPYDTIPPLAAGQFGEVRIKGRTLDTAVVIPRAALHADDTVWVVDPEENRLAFRNVTVARAGDSGVMIEAGLSDGDLVVVSPLKVVTDGMQVRHLPVSGDDNR